MINIPKRSRGLLTAIAFLASLLSISCANSDPAGVNADKADAAAASPMVTGPIPRGIGVPTRARPFGSNLFDLEPYGYTEEEFFIEGTASDFGKGATGVAQSAAYKTRLLVRRPVNPANFNGTVIVEWLNVTLSWDIDPDWIYERDFLIREGYAWVGVSAQQVSVNTSPVSLRSWDPVRYGTLSHPGDDFSFDIFSQAATVIRGPAVGVDPLRGALGRLDVQRIIAAGTSQSAARLLSFVNDYPGLARGFDAFLIRSVAGLSSDGGALSANPPVPVLRYQTESEVDGVSPVWRQDLPNLVLWEVAGSAHYSKRPLDWTFASAGRDFAGTPLQMPVSCGVNEPNRFPDHYAEIAAISHLDRWVRTGERPPVPALIETDAGGVIQRDSNGNALGGLRLPAIDVPTATYSGSAPPCPGLLALLGSTKSFSADEIRSLYPTHQDYVSKVDEAVAAAVQAGFLLTPDAPEIQAEAQAFDVWSCSGC